MLDHGPGASSGLRWPAAKCSAGGPHKAICWVHSLMSAVLLWCTCQTCPVCTVVCSARMLQSACNSSPQRFPNRSPQVSGVDVLQMNRPGSNSAFCLTPQMTHAPQQQHPHDWPGGVHCRRRPGESEAPSQDSTPGPACLSLQRLTPWVLSLRHAETQLTPQTVPQSHVAGHCDGLLPEHLQPLQGMHGSSSLPLG